jgi:hypothetical protein
VELGSRRGLNPSIAAESGAENRKNPSPRSEAQVKYSKTEARVLSAARNVKADLDTDHDVDWEDVRILAEWVLSELHDR